MGMLVGGDCEPENSAPQQAFEHMSLRFTVLIKLCYTLCELGSCTLIRMLVGGDCDPENSAPAAAPSRSAPKDSLPFALAPRLAHGEEVIQASHILRCHRHDEHTPSYLGQLRRFVLL